ncbi:hypothetical protein J4Q44_G00241260 [Coregonus suidteri]|uniref:Uncharacterized protein n=1 Tax=Coregonus suidteri TaxID=861788 RepID=A0AAN8QMY7_9TELE
MTIANLQLNKTRDFVSPACLKFSSEIYTGVRMAETEPWIRAGGPWEAPVHRPPVSWIKQWLWRPPTSRPKDEDRERHHAGQLEDSTTSPSSCCSRQRILLAILIMVALAVMALLLLWNYHCIMVWHLCLDEHSGFPKMIGGGIGPALSGRD